jgi:hypothetical protein
MERNLRKKKEYVCASCRESTPHMLATEPHGFFRQRKTFVAGIFDQARQNGLNDRKKSIEKIYS